VKISMKFLIVAATMGFAAAGLSHAQQAAKETAAKTKAASKAAQTTPAPATTTSPPTEAAPAGAPAQPGWVARCASTSREAPLECAMEQTAVLSKTGQLIVLINIRVPGDTHTPVATVQLPLGLNLPGGARLQVDDGKTTEDLREQRLLRRHVNRARTAGRHEIGKTAEGAVPEPRQGNHHHPAIADRFCRRLRQDQVVRRRSSIVIARSEATKQSMLSWIASPNL
jgi:invasion protein IalB